jgi:hypothetical protein
MSLAEEIVGKIVLKLFSEAAKGSIYAIVAEALKGPYLSKSRSLSDEDITRIARIIAEVSKTTSPQQTIDEAKLRQIIQREIQEALRQK